MSKYYAIVKGIQIGIFTDWNITKSYVNGYPGAIYKSFISRESALQYLNSNGVEIKSNQEQFNIIPIKEKQVQSNSREHSEEDTLYIYTDGSHTNHRGGIGLVYVYNKEIIYKLSAKVQEMPTTNNRAELFAIYVALYNLNNIKVNNTIKCTVIYTDSEYSVNIYNKNIIKWQKNEFKTISGDPVKNLDIILATWDIIKKSSDVSILWIKAHADNEYNNLADQLAKNGRDS